MIKLMGLAERHHTFRGTVKQSGGLGRVAD